MAGYKKQMTESEKRILKLLSDSNSDTLLVYLIFIIKDDVELISTLELSKVTSEEIKIKLVQSAELEKKIEETRNSYRDVSVRGSILFFVIKDLSVSLFKIL
jgi:dynein heavy chain